MKFLLGTVLVIFLSSSAYAAKIPPPVSMRFQITCHVDEKAEWTKNPDAPNCDSPAILVNSNTDSSHEYIEIDSKGNIYTADIPIEILISPPPISFSNRNYSIKTLTACWKI